MCYIAVKYYLSLISLRMKPKKQSQSKFEYIHIDHRKPNTQPHRKQNKSNKQNVIQLTEPLQPSHINHLSKQFILSRESLTLNSRPALSQITTLSNTTCVLDAKAKKLKCMQKQQEMFERRLSLKCGGHSQQLDSQQSHRFSMAAPLRKDIINSHNSQHLVDQRDSSYLGQSLSFSNENKSRHNIKKEVIMTNLMNKLEHEEDLRSIIQSKLRNTQTNNHSTKDRKNQSYLSEFTEDSNSNHYNTQKLRQTENELKYFKGIVRQMEQKMMQLTEEKKFSKRRQKVQNIDINEDHLKKDPMNYFITFLQKINQGVPKCENCEGNKKKVGREIGVQTCSTPKQEHNLNQSFDFLDNLQKTLKVLDEKRK